MFKYKNAIAVEFSTATDFEELRREIFAALYFIQLNNPDLHEDLKRLRSFYLTLVLED